MSLSRVAGQVGLPLLFAASTLAPNMAQAEDFLPYVGGKCYDSASTQLSLAQNGQRTLIKGNRNSAENHFPINVIMMNDSGFGYIWEEKTLTKVEAEKQGKAFPEKQLCLITRFADVQLNYEDNPEIPAWAVGIKNESGFNIENSYGKGIRLVFAAQSYTKDSSGDEKMGKSIVVGVLPGQRIARVLGVDFQGRASLSFDMQNYTIKTENYTHYIGRGYGNHAAGEGAVIAHNP